MKWTIGIFAAILCMYGAGRLYYSVTGGFTLGNITSDFAYDQRWEIKPLSDSEQVEVEKALSQDYRYLGKGCQSYVFLSQDGEYVIKFFKYQRFRPQFWLNYFTFIPIVSDYYDAKVERKKQKLDDLFQSWKVSYEELRPETGLVYVQLNKAQGLPKDFVIYDKVGLKYVLDLNQMEFLVQKKADMLCRIITKWMAAGEKERVDALLGNLVEMVVSEYHRGLADNDHALMQNTGVFQGQPIHIDVGQFVKNDAMKDRDVYGQELFNKTYKFRKWLRKNHPELLEELDRKLEQEIGDSFSTMQHQPKIR